MPPPPTLARLFEYFLPSWDENGLPSPDPASPHRHRLWTVGVPYGWEGSVKMSDGYGHRKNNNDMVFVIFLILILLLLSEDDL